MSTSDPLTNLRKAISDVDSEILKLVAERMELCKQVGEHKRQHHLPIKDYRVEKNVLDKARTKARELKIYPALAEDLLKTLITYSVIQQDELRVPSEAAPGIGAKDIAILGGHGHMGRWLSVFFDSLGHRVVVFDPTPSDQDDGSAFRVAESIEAAVTDADLIICATPLAGTAAVLDQLVPLKPRGIVVEICSLKSPVLGALERLAKAGVSVASIHPMFGPDIDILAGRNILFCEAPHLTGTEDVYQLLQVTSATLHRVDLAAHDSYMSYVLGAAHLINLINGRLMQRSARPLSEFERLGGTTFKNQLRVTKDVVRENQDLYFDIQVQNAFTPRLFAELKAVVAEYEKALAGLDREGFKELMSSADAYFARR